MRRHSIGSGFDDQQEAVGFSISPFGVEWSQPLQLTRPDESQVAKCCEWIALYGVTRESINPLARSYQLKHIVEAWAGCYISNGAFIEAALRCGLRMLAKRGDPNPAFNLATRCMTSSGGRPHGA